MDRRGAFGAIFAILGGSGFSAMIGAVALPASPYFTVLMYGGAAGVAVGFIGLLALVIWQPKKPPKRSLAALLAEQSEHMEIILDGGEVKAPVRNPDGIYQGGRLVGLVSAPRNNGAGHWSFERIDSAVDFDRAQPFEYRTYRMEFLALMIDGLTATGGVPARSLIGVTARVIG